jgi:hypothetical protein
MVSRKDHLGIEQDAHLVAPFEKGIDLFVGHGVPDMRVQDFDLAPAGAKPGLEFLRLGRWSQLGDRLLVADDGDALAP